MQPNTLIFVDLPSDDPEASGRFYAEVFGWEVEGPAGGGVPSHRPRWSLPAARRFTVGDRQPPHGHLQRRQRPARTRTRGRRTARVSTSGRTARVWILVSDDDSDERILDTAVRLGATELWRRHYWAEFNGFNSAFLDPWGNTLVLWTKGGSDPVVPEGWTRE
jgi:predicted enzyme related to lactoylglutathione lyase